MRNDRRQRQHSKRAIATAAKRRSGKAFRTASSHHYTRPRKCWRWASSKANTATTAPRNFRKTGSKTPSCPSPPTPSLNYFGVKSRQPLSVWREKGWIYGPDPRGWFQWYCRYYLGRRLGDIDEIQIKRWRAFARHAGQVKANCMPSDIFCRPRQRQALLQWSYDALI